MISIGSKLERKKEKAVKLNHTAGHNPGVESNLPILRPYEAHATIRGIPTPAVVSIFTYHLAAFEISYVSKSRLKANCFNIF